MNNLKIFCKSLFILVIFFNYDVKSQQQGIIIDVDFPGGNIIVDDRNHNSSLFFNVSGDTVFLRPDLRDTEGDWFYWNFRITGAPNRTLVFQFPSRKIGSLGPAYSLDGGESWQWLYEKIYKGHDCFSYTFGPNDHEVMFSVCIPYLRSDFQKFIAQYQNHPLLSTESLITSEKGRNVEKIIIGQRQYAPNHKVVFTARHHANESMASYALEGLIASILDDDDISMKWLRENVEFLILPFMDKDGVEDGDQGKNRMPRDHVLDYSDNNIYNSTATLRKELPAWANGQLKVAIDFHCPWLFGEWHEKIHFVGARDEKMAKEQYVFVDILKQHQRGELKLDPKKPILDYGVFWNVWDDKDDKSDIKSFTEWASTIDGVSLSVIMEFPFANNNGQIVTPQNTRLFGKDMAKALALYLQSLDSKNK